MQKEMENLEFVQGVNFEFIDSLKNNGRKYLLIFDDSCEEICNSKAFVDIATAGRHRGLSTIYNKHNLFNQSKLGRDVELQNTHIVLFKSPRDVMQVTTLSAQLSLGSELVDCYRDATSVPFGHLLIDLLPRTDDRLRFCTNSGSVPSKFYIPERLKHLRTLENENTKSLHSPTTSLDENCIEFGFQTDRNYYVNLRQSFLALKLKFVKGLGYDTYESKEKKKEHKDESVVFTETGDDSDQEEEVARVTYVNNIMHSIFSNVEVYINNQ